MSAWGYRRVPAAATVNPRVRLPRSVLPDGIYHVTTHGVAEIAVFRDDADREYFVALLQIVARHFGWRLRSWCLMDTHYHLIVETTREQLSDGMQRLNGLYAQRYNR